MTSAAEIYLASIFTVGAVIPAQLSRAPKPLFNLGNVSSTPGALAALAAANVDPAVYLTRHVIGDWGVMDDFDKRQNELAIKQGLRIISIYNLPPDNTRIYIITEADRSATTFLLPDKY